MSTEGKKYVCGDLKKLQSLDIPKLEEKLDKNQVFRDWGEFSKQVCKFLQQLKTYDKNPISGNYDKFLKKIEALCKEKKVSIDSPGMLLFGDGVIEKIVELCEKYIKEGEDEERIAKIKDLKERLLEAKRNAVHDVAEHGMNGGRDFSAMNSPVYKDIILEKKLAEQFNDGKAEHKFLNNNHLEKIILTDDVKSVHRGAFENCYNLKVINVAKRTKNLIFPNGSIKNCPKLERIEGKGNAEFENKAIQNCPKLKD